LDCPDLRLFGILMESKARQGALEITAVRDREKVLEVALGTGLNFVEILKRNPNGWVDGIDVPMKMVEKAKKKYPKLGKIIILFISVIVAISPLKMRHSM
jgi:ubiquinone/menaquinone biosynthesis C-methylase UbiE